MAETLPFVIFSLGLFIEIEVGVWMDLANYRWEAAAEGLCEPLVIARWEAAAETAVNIRWVTIVLLEAVVKGSSGIILAVFWGATVNRL